jgi:hypothetical protein
MDWIDVFDAGECLDSVEANGTIEQAIGTDVI